MEQYDAVMENTHMIVEKERQHQEKEWDLESDSELLMPASGLFNGMEGIEPGGAKSGDVEMSGTGASLTD
jgi:hypothetical protein